jgi:hypothetical protein
MTPADLARAIHDRHCAAARAAGRPWRRWSDLWPWERGQLLREARQLQSGYSAGGDAPSRGMR